MNLEPKNSIFMKKKLVFLMFCMMLGCFILAARVIYIQIFNAEEYQAKAYEQQTRDRLIAPQRGSILDRKGVGIAITESANAVSVIRAQIKNPQEAAEYLSQTLELDYDDVLKKVNQKVALVRIKSKVDAETALEIRKKAIPGIVVDEDVKRAYPFSDMAAQVIGFVGKDNQGIIGLEAKYDEYLKGSQGKILTLSDAKGLQLDSAQDRIEPTAGYDLVTSIDSVIQQYAEQTIAKAVEAKGAKRGVIIALNPQNGEIYAMANYPSFDLNKPFEINKEELKDIWDTLSQKEQTDLLNQMWRNTAINDTYEPGSTFKIVTASAGLSEGVITPESGFNCNGYYIAGDRMIKCWRYPRSHGSQSFTQGVQNSCNPVFMAVAERLGAEKFYKYLLKFGFDKKTGIDLPGEAVGIMHKLENVGPVELATMSFGQSFQITPLQLLRAASAIVNGGKAVTPHFATAITDKNGNVVKKFEYENNERIISEETSTQMKTILESVVAEGTGNKAYIAGYRIGGKTATSEKLPRRSGKYIASFMSFAPAENPQVMAFVLIDEPQGVYYGGTVAGPVMKEFLANALPYLGIEPIYNEKEAQNEEIKTVDAPDVVGLTAEEAKKALADLKLGCAFKGEGETVVRQLPPPNEKLRLNSEVILYLE